METININNYLFTKPLTNDNSGFSRWGIGTRGENCYFVKEFLSPTYPVSETAFNEKQRERKIEECRKFEKEKIRLYQEIDDVSDGNLVRIHQFFRVGAKYYISTRAIQEKPLSVQEIAKLSYEKRLTICCAVAHAVAKLHGKRIVHADLKPDNILITNENELRIGLIDFDSGFFEDNCPGEDDELNGDLVYLSPEAFLYMAEMESHLTCAMDVFAMALILHQYLTGEIPKFDTDAYTYLYEAVLDDEWIEVSDDIPSMKLKLLLLAMMKKIPEERPDMQNVFETFQEELLEVTGRRERVGVEKGKRSGTEDGGIGEKTDSPKTETKETTEETMNDFFTAAGDL